MRVCMDMCVYVLAPAQDRAGALQGAIVVHVILHRAILVNS